MKSLIKRLTLLLVDPKSMIFGAAIFNFIWVWLRSPEWHFHRNIFMATLLLIASVLLVLNKSWSNLVAAILSGYLPIGIIGEFWMYAYHAEVPIFSYRHFKYFFGNIEVGSGVLLFIALTFMILGRAVYSVMHSIPKRITPNDA